MEYITNVTEDQCHAAKLNSLLKEAVYLDCMVAFAKMSGFSLIEKELEAALERKKFKARFVVGLDFYQTEPSVLNKLFSLSKNKKYNLSLFISNSTNGIFHPKVYAFQYSDGFNYVVGSANLTNGGLLKNSETSLLTTTKSNKLMENINKQIQQLIQSQQVIKATKKAIDSYEKKYAIHSIQRKLAKHQTKDTLENETEGNFETLKNLLELMKRDETKDGFESCCERRCESRGNAIRQLDQIINERNIHRNFLELYEPLVQGHHLWHSGGLHRGKNKIAQNAEKFQSGLEAVKKLQNPSSKEAYSTLHKICSQS